MQARYEVHHVGIPLDEHQPIDFNRAVFAHAAEIVAPEIDEHDVLGALFRIGEEFGLEFAIFLIVAPARPRASERLVKRIATLDFHQHLG